nr:acyl-CoA dehydrogenase family protein [Zoogloeaceae bacterium]
MNYVAPVKDMLFAMNELAGLAEISALPGNEEVSVDLVETILDEAGKFASEVLAPINASGDKEGNTWADGVVSTASGFKEAYASFCETGWNGMPAAVEFGGQGLPVTVSTAVLEMWKSANMSFSLCQMLTLGAVEAIAHHASDELKQIYLPNMVAGTWTGTMNLTEPQAGSDLAAVRSKAEPRGDGSYAVSGTKIFITWGEHDMAENIIHLVLARLPDAPPGVKGISLFIVPKFLVNADGSLGARNDLVCASIEHKMGIHASATAVMAFGEKDGAIGYLVGEANRGLEYMFTMMNHARLNVGLEGVAISERAYQHALAYARERIQGRIVG